MSAVVLGPVVAADADDLTEVGFTAWATSPFGHDNGSFENTRFRNEFLTFCRDQPEVILAARHGGRIVGWGAREAGDALVQDLWIAPEWQGRGIGRMVLATLEAAMIAEGLPASELETYAGNAGARGFYAHVGYNQVWHRLQWSGGLGYEIDKIGFNKPLTSKA